MIGESTSNADELVNLDTIDKAARFPLTFEDCVANAGHCFVRDNIVLTTDPPQYPEFCKHCGATRIGREQPRMTYTEPQPREGS